MAIGKYGPANNTTGSATTTTYQYLPTYDFITPTAVRPGEKTPLEWLDAQVEATCALARAAA